MARVLVLCSLAKSLVNFRGPLIEALKAAGHEVHAAGPAAEESTQRWLAARRVPYYEMPLSRTGLSPVSDIQTFRVLLRIMGFAKPDVTIAYTIKPVVYGTLAAAARGVPRRYAMITGLGQAFSGDINSPKRILANRVARLLYWTALRKCQTVVFQNPDDLQDFRTMGLLPAGAKTVIVNGSGVDIDYFSEVPLPTTRNVVMVSRVLAEKGVVEFIEAARIVRQTAPDVSFTLVGPFERDGDDLPPGLLDKAMQDGTIRYIGPVDDVRPALTEASIFVLPSRYREGQPRAILEAMAMGRPVITTDMPGCRETVLHGINGFLVPPGSSAKLAAAIGVLIDDPRLLERMGHAARTIAVDKYEAKRVAASMLDAYDLA